MMIQEKSQYDLEKNADPNYCFMYSFINLFKSKFIEYFHVYIVQNTGDSIMKTHLAPA